MKPSEYYHQDLLRQGYESESGQLAIIGQMDAMHARMYGNSLVSRMRKKSIRGLYIHGGVGRGKTYLLDIFHQTAPANSSLRMHFHAFMRDIHQRLQNLPKSPNPLPMIARQIARDTRVLCLDELFVDDIADAMVLVGLLPALGEAGVSLITTSNLEPDALYENGLQRLHFLLAIDWLKQNTEVITLDHELDYRCHQGLASTGVYILDGAGLERGFRQRLQGHAIHEDGQVWLQGRSVPFLLQAGQSGILFDFHALCATARSVRDYLELAEYYRLVALRDVYMMGEQQDDVAKRFMHLVDALYDHGVPLMVGSEAPLAALYQGRKLQHNFRRTLSRLYEMTR